MKLLPKMFCVLAMLSIFYMSAQPLKVMTYNIRLDVESDGANDWNHRKDFLTSQIRFYEPDILGIQEAKPNQVIDMENLLNIYDNVGMGRDGIGKGESSNIFYNKERFAIEESSTFWLSETPNVISLGWDAACNRVCTYALFKDLKTRKQFWIFNTHLDHVGEEAKTKGIKLILERIRTLNTKNYPVVFMGDFNSEAKDDRIIALKNVMTDCREASMLMPFGPSGTFNNFKYNEPVTKLIDYIFISNKSDFKVNKYAILTDAKELRFPSDHFPVYVELQFR